MKAAVHQATEIVKSVEAGSGKVTIEHGAGQDPELPGDDDELRGSRIKACWVNFALASAFRSSLRGMAADMLLP
jgi:hypothetical protein